MSNPRRITCDESLEDAAFVARFVEDVETLAGLAVEMMVEHRSMVLSPVFRRMLAEKAYDVQSRLGPLKNILHADNPPERPLQSCPVESKRRGA